MRVSNDLRIRRTSPTPDPFAVTSDRNDCLFHRHIEADILFHWLFSVRCLGPASGREPVFPSYRGTATSLHCRNCFGRPLPRLPHVDGARAASGSTKGRAKMVVVEATVCRSAVHGKVYHQFVVCHHRWAQSGEACFFRSIALMLWGALWSPKRSGATRCWSSSFRCRLAWSGLRPAGLPPQGAGDVGFSAHAVAQRAARSLD
jgi:hypothetical protein